MSKMKLDAITRRTIALLDEGRTDEAKTVLTHLTLPRTDLVAVLADISRNAEIAENWADAESAREGGPDVNAMLRAREYAATIYSVIVSVRNAHGLRGSSHPSQSTVPASKESTNANPHEPNPQRADARHVPRNVAGVRMILASLAIPVGLLYALRTLYRSRL